MSKSDTPIEVGPNRERDALAEEARSRRPPSRGALMRALLAFREGLSQVALDVGFASRADFPCE